MIKDKVFQLTSSHIWSIYKYSIKWHTYNNNEVKE